MDYGQRASASASHSFFSSSSSSSSEREALRACAEAILELENDQDLRHAIALSYDDAAAPNAFSNPQTYSDEKKQAVLEYEAAKKKVKEKKRQLRRLEKRIRRPNRHAHNSANEIAGFDDDDDDDDDYDDNEEMNPWPANNGGWGQQPEASFPYRMSTSSGPFVPPPTALGSRDNSNMRQSDQTSRFSDRQPSRSFAGNETGRNTPVNNKRSFGSASDSFNISSPGRSKSQRTGDVSADIIDLTGDDDDINTSISRSRQTHWHPSSNAVDLVHPARNRLHTAENPHSAFSLGLGPGSMAADYGGCASFAPGNRFPSMPRATPGPSAGAVPRMPGSFVSDEDDYGSRFTPPNQLLNPYGAAYRDLTAGRSSLSTAEAINRTRNFNFGDLTDGHGNRLDPRVASIMQDINDDPRKSREEVEALLRNVHAGVEIPEEDRDGTPDEMKYPLYAHQRVALTWMKRQEKGTNKGGILADAMGLGKTISVLSLMMAHPPTTHTKTTLIVAPLSLIRQWEDEIKKKIKPANSKTVYVFHSTQKKIAKELMTYDVVLTTYGTLVSEKKKLAAWWKKNDTRRVNTKTDSSLASSVSLFHPNYSMFYRVVLDESQMIKNRKAQAAEAVAALQSQYRWCLSGTPMMNGVDELYSLYHFLRIKPYNDWTSFRVAFGVLFGKNGDPKSKAMRNLQVLLKATLLRRTKESTIDGKPILQLPQKSEEVIYAELDEDERKFYTDLETKSQVQINKYLRKGTLGKHYSHVLVLLLRLRQSCCHPHLLLDSDEAVPEVDDGMLDRVKTLSFAVVTRLTEKSRAIENADAIDEGFECPICYDMMPDPTIPLPCGHEICAGCLKQHVDNAKRDNIRNGEENGQVKCAVCRGPLDPKNVITFSAFKKVYMPGDDVESSEVEESDGSVWSSDDEEDEDAAEDEEAAEEEEGHGDDEDEADKNGNLRGFVVGDDIYENISDADDRSSTASEPKPKPKPMPILKTKSRANKKGKKKAVSSGKESKKRVKKIKASMLYSLRKDAKKNAAAFRDYTRYLSHNWLDSSKTRACMELLCRIQETGEKTIVFSQWTMLLDLLEVAIKKEGLNIKHCRYTGEMSMSQRDDTAFKFTTDPSVKVMMVSLRAGNAGLNLVAASRVIIMDPFWNPYIEMQAVDRAHRIGQQKPVKVYRILTQSTVEDRIVQLQEKKRATVDAALDERESAKLAGLSMRELRFLFNL